MRLFNAIVKALILTLTMLTLSSCSEINTTNPKETYKYWTGTNSSSDIELLSGQYWQSAHWTREYILYLEFKPSEKWWQEFLEENNISVDKSDWVKPTDAPTWFNPSKNSIRFGGNIDFDQGSRYFKDTLTGVCYIYEIQL